MSDREIIIPKGMEFIYEQIHYAPAVRVGNILYIAGQIGRNEKMEVIRDTEAQYVQAFENLKSVLEAAGGTLADVVDVITYHTDMRDLPLYMKVRDRYFTQDYPAWTALGTSALGIPGLQLEIKATAVLRR